MEINGLLIFGLFYTFLNALTVKDFFNNSENFSSKEKPFSTVDWYSSQYDKYTSDQFKAEITTLSSSPTEPKKCTSFPLSQNSVPQFCSTQFALVKEYNPYRNMFTPVKEPIITKSVLTVKEIEANTKAKGKEELPKVNGKYTCRYEVQIKNENDFQVSKKIIGAKGCFMKKIVNAVCIDQANLNNDVLKLRLRGSGSNYLEGEDHQGVALI